MYLIQIQIILLESRVLKAMYNSLFVQVLGESAEYKFLLEFSYNIIRKLLEAPHFFIHYVSNTNL